jgi:Zn2+/Cd2+-exporting ATPase
LTSIMQLDLPLILPKLEAGDRCVEFLTERLAHKKGIDEAHIVREGDNALLCLHYDPNLVSLSELERLAQEAGAEVTQQYRHETLPFTGLDAADTASVLETELARLPGMVHVRVSYAAGLIFIAYDTSRLTRGTIEQTIRRFGAQVVAPAPKPQSKAEHQEHDHGSAPAFLPHWMQERWTLLLVAIAGLLLLVGWAGEQFFGLSTTVATVLFILSMIAGGYDVATHAIPALLKGKFDTDVLMLAAALGAALLGEWAEGAFLLFLFSLGHAGEHYALDRARNAINALGELMPKTARVRRGDQIIEADVNELTIGDIVVVRPGDRIPVDGTVVAGTSGVDQSPITGESVPVTKQPKDGVFAGTVNQDAALDIEVTQLAADNTLSRVTKLVAEAQSQQSPTQQETERFTSWFVPAVLIGTVLFIIVPPLIGWMPLEQSFYRAMLLLVAASPCALAIGTPAAVLAGIAQAARNGVLIKGGVHLENSGRLQAIAFDKTGTITSGRFSVTDIVPINGVTPDEVLQVAGAVEQQSSHPLAVAVVRAAQEKKLLLPPAQGLENMPGRGIKSAIAGETVLIGTLKLFRETPGHRVDERLERLVADLEARGRTTMAISRGGKFLGVIGLADTPRPNAKAVMQELRTLGIPYLVMLTGDNEAVATRIAREVGLSDVQAELLPEQKLQVIKSLEKKYEAIAMVGDGVNDAPALATATVGVAMGGAGTAVALETADMALMADDLGKLPFAIGLSRASRTIIRQNLAISLGIIALLIVSSVLAITQLSGAVILHEGSTIIVVANALRLLAYQRPEATAVDL